MRRLLSLLGKDNSGPRRVQTECGTRKEREESWTFPCQVGLLFGVGGIGGGRWGGEVGLEMRLCGWWWWERGEEGEGGVMREGGEGKGENGGGSGSVCVGEEEGGGGGKESKVLSFSFKQNLKTRETTTPSSLSCETF